MSGRASRRGFLRGLTTLPLIGGGVTLIGSPVGAAEAPSRACLVSYLAWLHFEKRVVLSTGTEVSAIVGIENSLIGGRVVLR